MVSLWCFLRITKQSIAFSWGYKFRLSDCSENCSRRQPADCPIWLFHVPGVINYGGSNNKHRRAANSKHEGKTKQKKTVVCLNDRKQMATAPAQTLPATDCSCDRAWSPLLRWSEDMESQRPLSHLPWAMRSPSFLCFSGIGEGGLETWRGANQDLLF